MDQLPSAQDKPLFTPGPLTTSRTVKQALLRDLGSRDGEFIDTVARVRRKLLDLAGVSKEAGYEAVLVQGSGTFSVEAMISSLVPDGGKLLVLENGAYGQRIEKIAKIHRIPVRVLHVAENEVHTAEKLASILEEDGDITAVALVHCETTSGIINPVEELASVIQKHEKLFLLDSMSAFGAVPIDFEKCGIDCLVTSSNKCIEGVPGFGVVIVRRSVLEQAEGQARTLSLDLHAQWQGLERNGQFRFTPPVQVILAFEQALLELDAEGGVEARAARYRLNHDVLVTGLRAMGFVEYVPHGLQGHIITSFRYPDNPKFDFERFYSLLNERGFVIYPGKVSDADCFRIGTIGRLFPSDVENLLQAIRAVSNEMGFLGSSS